VKESKRHTQDPLDRLLNASLDGNNTPLSWSYDRYGNRLSQSGGGYTPQNLTYSGNRISSSGFAYDAAGNLVWDGSRSFCYDAEGRMLRVVSDSVGPSVQNPVKPCDASVTALAEYVYDPSGLRVRVTNGADIREYVYDLSGREAGEIKAGVVQRQEVYLGGAHLAVIARQTDGTNKMFYLHSDWLGTVRKATSNDALNEGTCQNYPYGDGLGCSGAAPFRHFFTDYVRDSESGLEHSWFRQYSARVGQYGTADPVLGRRINPQTWNRYAYAINNPIRYVDPRGLNLMFCSATFSYSACGGDWGFSGGGAFGDHVAQYGRDFGEVPESMREGYSRYLNGVNGALPSGMPSLPNMIWVSQGCVSYIQVDATGSTSGDDLGCAEGYYMDMRNLPSGKVLYERDV